jgi:hypothetical protein
MAVKITLLESKILPVSKITVEADGDTPEKTYDVVLDFNALIKAEEVTGLDFSKRASWHGLKPAQISAIAWAGLDRFHPEVTLHTVRQWFAPVEWAQLFVMLFEQCHPGVLDALEQLAASEQPKGGDEPNPQVTV